MVNIALLLGVTVQSAIELATAVCPLQYSTMQCIVLSTPSIAYSSAVQSAVHSRVQCIIRSAPLVYSCAVQSAVQCAPAASLIGTMLMD